MNFKKLTTLAIPFYEHDDPSHDFAHIKRILKTCTLFGEQLGADLNLLLPAALLHDIVNLPKDHPERKKGSEFAAHKAEELLLQADYSPAEIAAIKKIIIEHSFSRGEKPSTLESQILQDADRLDTLGAIGIMRTTTVGSKMGAHYYHPEDPWAKQRDYDDKKYTLDHYFTKLFKLPAMMNTTLGQKEAEKRVLFMQNFLHAFTQEVGIESK
tara:strand:- start:5595 stop:6230 length:636 start_codon:yes stop_codon:yes gene_type:complete